MRHNEPFKTFEDWNKVQLNSYLIKITRCFLLERIRDTAGQKCTGKWTTIFALHYGVNIASYAQRLICEAAKKVELKLL